MEFWLAIAIYNSEFMPMEHNLEQSTSSEISKAAFWKTVKTARQKTPTSFLLAFFTIGLIIIGIVISLSSQVITIVDSDYTSFVIMIIGVVLVAMASAIFIALFWEESTVTTLQENERLKNELSLLKEHLATAQARNNDLVKHKETEYELWGNRKSTQLNANFDQISKLIEAALIFESNPNLKAEELKTTHVKSSNNNIVFVVPVGRLHGAKEGLNYYVLDPEQNHTEEWARLGTIELREVGTESSQAPLIHQEEVEEAGKYWGTIDANYKLKGEYPLELKLQPIIHPLFQDKPHGTLSSIHNLLQEIKEVMNHQMLAKSAENITNLDEKIQG
jgi:hypothetical protein